MIKDMEHFSPRLFNTVFLYRSQAHGVMELQAWKAYGKISLYTSHTLGLSHTISCERERMLGGMVPVSNLAQFTYMPAFIFFIPQNVFPGFPFPLPSARTSGGDVLI